jgi:CRISPR-associated protein Csh1
MITEIAKFVETIPEHYHTKDLPRAKGLHIYIDLDKIGKPIKDSYRSIIIDKKNKVFDLNNKNEIIEIDYQGDIEKREYYSRWIESNKALDSSKKIHSSNTFALWFKKKNLLGIKDSFEVYFKKANENAAQNRDVQIGQIKEFCKQELIHLIREDPKLKKTDKEDYIKIYFNVSLETVKEDFESYLKKNLFNKEDYNLVSSKGETLGLSGFMNGANSKKQFMLHKTSHFEINNRISQKTALNLYKFERLLSHKKPYDKLPNPLPIFIDKDELNKNVVRLYNDERVLHFREIVRRLFEQHQTDLSDYYLINWRNTADGPVIYDFDFVPQFRYRLSGFEIKNSLGIKDFQERKINTIFEFELDVVRMIFNNALVLKTKNDEIMLRYFDDIDPKYMSAATYQNILKYRKSFYDYIYKSRTQAITGKMFYDLIISAVVDDIKRDEEFNKTQFIREKLNILFSLNHIFDTNNNNFKGVNMASKIPEYQERMRKLFSDENYHIAEDDEFAFAAGQLIYYILKQSKSSNKSHALLEPFISKSDPEQFRQMIIRGIDQYKHAFEWYGSGKGRFEKLTGEIMGYECKTNVKDMLPVILAGYFSQSLIYESSKNTQTK